MQDAISPKLLVLLMVCVVLTYKGKVKLAVTVGIGYMVCLQIFAILFKDEDDPTAPGADQADAVARVQAIVPYATEADIRAQLRRTRSIEATVEALSARGGGVPVVVGAPKGRNRTVSFQSKKDSVFDKYRDKYLEQFPERVKRNTDLKAAGVELELDHALRQCRRPGGH
eukprot:m.455803 g.455803  ORF g.455803 m.455803 type:complete len:170 (-) comp20938_c0_seq1:34-543(-)